MLIDYWLYHGAQAIYCVRAPAGASDDGGPRRGAAPARAHAVRRSRPCGARFHRPAARGERAQGLIEPLARVRPKGVASAFSCPGFPSKQRCSRELARGQGLAQGGAGAAGRRARRGAAGRARRLDRRPRRPSPPRPRRRAAADQLLLAVQGRAGSAPADARAGGRRRRRRLAGRAPPGRAHDLPALAARRADGAGPLGHSDSRDDDRGRAAHPDRAHRRLRCRELSPRLWRRFLRPHPGAAWAGRSSDRRRLLAVRAADDPSAAA